MFDFPQAHQGQTNKPTRSSFVTEGVIVASFCACFAFFVISNSRNTSATYDETTHLPSGYSYLKWNDYRMNPEHPPLIKLWAALPLLRLQVWPSPAAMDQQIASDTLPELAGGPRNGYKWLVDSNLDWGQDLKGLKRWADRHRISESEPINLCYFGMADPRYYQIPHIKLPGGYALEPPVRQEETFGIAKKPGYVAISATHLQGLYFSTQQRAYWREFLKNAVPVDTLGYSIFIYRIDHL